MNSLIDLGTYITRELSNGIPLKDLTTILSVYKGSDWKKYIKFDPNIPYVKNQAYINDRIEIVIITWQQFQSSRIHDHPTGGCLLRIMSGSLIEDIYEKNRLIQTNQLNSNQISHQIGNQYLHKITNPTDMYVVSLHIYSPPNYKITYWDL